MWEILQVDLREYTFWVSGPDGPVFRWQLAVMVGGWTAVVLLLSVSVDTVPRSFLLTDLPVHHIHRLYRA
jgi:hypothetical protein